MQRLLLHPDTFAAVTFLFVLLLLDAGWRLGRRAQRRNGGREIKGIGALEGAVFALLGLLLAFTFSGAANRFDNRRVLAVQEANDVTTTYLRIATLKAEDRPGLEKLVRDYTQSRLQYYATFEDEPERDVAERATQSLRERLWVAAVAAAGAAFYSQILAPINQMFETATTRAGASRMHPPRAIYIMLAALVAASALIAGYAMSNGHSRPWLHAFVFAAVIAATLYTIVEMEYPRYGILRIDDFDQYLVRALANMKSTP